MSFTELVLRGKKVKVPEGSKSDKARHLLGQGYTVSEVSKAIPAAYSQVHQISKTLAPQAKAKPVPALAEDLETIAKRDVPTARQKAKSAKATKTGVTRSVGKLRTGGLPSDIEVGACANCGHDISIRRTPTGYILAHVNTTAEEYLAVVQFCQAVPEILIPI